MTLVLLSAWYVLVCLLFGWWGGSILKPFRNIKRTLHDLNVNLNGGIDFTKEMNDDAYDDETNFVWNNLTRESRSRIEKSTLEFILVLHNNFEQINHSMYSKENMDYIICHLGQIEVVLTRTVLEDVFEAIESWVHLYNK